MSSRRRVLLIGESEDAIERTRLVFDSIPEPDYALEWTTEFAQALEVLADAPPEAVLLDLDDKAGAAELAALRLLQADGYSGPVVILTGQIREGFVQEALQAGAVDCLPREDLVADSLARTLRFAAARGEATRARIDSLRARTALEQAELVSQAKTEFIAYMSHELRTPLAAMLGYSDLLRLRLKNETLLTYVNTITLNGRHLLNLMGDFLDISKIEAGQLLLEPVQSQLIDVLREVYSVAVLQAIDKNVDLRVEFDGLLPSSLYVDGRRLAQMLLNLLSNAMKFSNDGEVVWHIGYDATAQHLDFSIVDNGIGIHESELAQIFEPFRRAGETEALKGLGLGLAITRSLAERMNGRITVASVLGEGSRFNLFVGIDQPGELIEMDILDLQEVPSIATDSQALNGTALIVDDSDAVRELLAEMLAVAGMSVTQSVDGEAALSVVNQSERPPDVILLDMQLPGIDGYGVARELRSLGYRGGILAITAAALDGARARCIAAGCDNYLSKPVDKAALLGAIAALINKSDEQVPAGKVLLVEDAESVRDATIDLLTALGFDAVGAANPEEALKLAKSFRPDAVLLDLDIAGRSGIDLAREFESDDALKSIHRFALSGRDRSSVPRGERLLFADFLEKPLDLRLLDSALGRLGVRATPG